MIEFWRREHLDRIRQSKYVLDPDDLLSARSRALASRPLKVPCFSGWQFGPLKYMNARSSHINCQLLPSVSDATSLSSRAPSSRCLCALQEEGGVAVISHA